MPHPRLSRTVVVAATVLAVLTPLLTPAAAHALTTPPGPTAAAATFAGWDQGQDEVTFSWTPSSSGVDGYFLTYESGDTAPQNYQVGVNVPVPGGGQVSSVTATIAPFSGDLSFEVSGYAGTSQSFTGISNPATATLVNVPTTPTLTATPVSGAVGQATLAWPAPLAGDSLILREGITTPATPTDGTSVPLAAGQRSLGLTGLESPPASIDYSLFELTGGDVADWSPPSSESASPAPPADGTLHATVASGQPTVATLNWARPAGCLPAATVCDTTVVLENPGSQVAADPTDGILETMTGGVTTDTDSVTDITAGNNYTFTLFNVETISGTQYWSVPTSATLNDTAVPGLSLTSSPAKGSTVGQKVTLVATLVPHGAPLTGSVSFHTTSHVLCNVVPLTLSGKVACNTTAASIADEVSGEPDSGYDVFANYSGDAKNTPATAGIIVVVHKAAATLSTVAKPATVARGRKLVVTTTVGGAAGRGTGTVEFSAGAVILCRAKVLSKGMASCRVAAATLGVGRHTIVVTYGGNLLYKTTKQKVKITVTKK
jgi:Bacterial Ig-like domain (group 3)